MLMGPEDAARGREGELGAAMEEGASWMRRKRRVADKAFIAGEECYRSMRGWLWSFVSSRRAPLGCPAVVYGE